MKIILSLISIPVIIWVLFAFWAMNAPEPGNWAKQTLTGDETFLVSGNREWIRVQPLGQYKGSIIFYPGGRVKAESYSPLAASLASAGYEVFLLKVPFNMAIFASRKAEEVIKTYPDQNYLALGGHSLGGVTAASYWDKTDISGLILLAAYPSKPLNRQQPVLAIFGSEDNLLSQEDRLNLSARIPSESQIEEIKGGNHAQFGDYGLQSGDGRSTISQMEQNAAAFQAIKNYLEELEL